MVEGQGWTLGERRCGRRAGCLPHHLHSPPPHISTATTALATATFTTATFTTATATIATIATIATTGRGRGARARLARLGPLQRREDVGVWLLGVEEVEGGGEVVPLERRLVRVAARERGLRILVKGVVPPVVAHVVAERGDEAGQHVERRVGERPEGFATDEVVHRVRHVTGMLRVVVGDGQVARLHLREEAEHLLRAQPQLLPQLVPLEEAIAAEEATLAQWYPLPRFPPRRPLPARSAASQWRSG